jgi:hypothetical protein
MDVGETVAKLALLVTDHVHVLPVLTANVALPPAPDMLKVDVEMEYVQVDCGGGVGDVGDAVDFEHDVTPARAITARMRPRTFPPSGAKQRLCREPRMGELELLYRFYSARSVVAGSIDAARRAGR